MKIIIAGSRTIANYRHVLDAMRSLRYCEFMRGRQLAEIVSGKSPKGVDRLGELWASLNQIPVRPFPAEWTKHGRKVAGFIRNAEMAEYADALVAVWDGESPGTQDMILAMRRLNKPVHIWIPEVGAIKK